MFPARYPLPTDPIGTTLKRRALARMMCLRMIAVGASFAGIPTAVS